MRTLSSIIFIWVFISPINISKATTLTLKNTDCFCKANKPDSLEEPLIFNFGKFQGKCIDSCRFRRARILSENSIPPKIIEVGNILHLGTFYKGKISIDKISSVEAGFEEFMPGVYHVFLKFQLNKNSPPIRLFGQSHPNEPAIETRSLVLSSEGVPPKGYEYSLIESYLGNYLLAYRLITGEEMDRRIRELKNTAKLFSLKLSSEQASKILLRGIRESDRMNLENIYHLFSNNCSTSAFSFIDPELEESHIGEHSSWTRLEDALSITGPIGALHSLIRRKLVSDQM